ncbi:YqkE family protein [Paenibacillus larvae]
MAKKKKVHSSKPVQTEKQATLKDLLGPEIQEKLKAQAQEMKAEEEQKKAAQKKQAEEARKAEQKRLDNDFEYLLNNSKIDWKSFK